jgi:hypothetical protein
MLLENRSGLCLGVWAAAVFEERVPTSHEVWLRRTCAGFDCSLEVCASDSGCMLGNEDVSWRCYFVRYLDCLI